MTVIRGNVNTARQLTAWSAGLLLMLNSSINIHLFHSGLYLFTLRTAPSSSGLMITVRVQTMGGLPQDAGCQASPLPPRNNFSQYEVRTLADGERQAVLGSAGFASFLSAVEPR